MLLVQHHEELEVAQECGLVGLVRAELALDGLYLLVHESLPVELVVPKFVLVALDESER